MAINPSIDPISSTEFTLPTTDRKSKAGLGVKLSTAALSALGPADMALSDGFFAKALKIIEKSVHPFGSEMLNRAAQMGSISAVLMGESFAFGMLVANNNTLQGSLEAFDKYTERKRAEMGIGKRAVSAVVKSPLTAIGFIGEKIDKAGEKVSSMNFNGSDKVGSVISDIGNTNALGTTTVIMNESMRSKEPIGARRVGRLSATITASWLATAESIRYLYRGIGELGKPGHAIQNGIGAFARGLDALTTVGVNPAETPVGSLFMGAVVGSLAVTGWNIAEMKHSMDHQQPAFEPIRTDS
jgi:hypothetical protein